MKRDLMSKLFLCLIVMLAICAAVCAENTPSEPLVSIEFKNTPLPTVIESLFKGTNHNYTLSPQISALNLTVTAVLKNVSFDDALKQVLKPAGAIYKVENGTYVIKPEIETASINQASPPPVRQVPPPTPGQRSYSSPGQSNTADGKEIEIKIFDLKYANASNIALFIRDIVQPNRGGSLSSIADLISVSTTSNNRLLVSGPKEKLDEVSRLITTLDADARAVRVKLCARITVGTAKGPKTYQVSTENVGVEGEPMQIGLIAQTLYPNKNAANTASKDKQAAQKTSSSNSNYPTNNISATITPSVGASEQISLVGGGYFGFGFGPGNRSELVKSFDLAASVASGKSIVIATGAIDVESGKVDFTVTATASIEQGRVPAPWQKQLSPGYNSYGNSNTGGGYGGSFGSQAGSSYYGNNNTRRGW